MENFPVANFELENQEVILQEICESFGLDIGVRNAAFSEQSKVEDDLVSMKKRKKLARRAMEKLLDGLKPNLSKEEFKFMMATLIETFPDAGSVMGGAMAHVVELYEMESLVQKLKELTSEKNQHHNRQTHKHKEKKLVHKEKLLLHN